MTHENSLHGTVCLVFALNFYYQAETCPPGLLALFLVIAYTGFAAMGAWRFWLALAGDKP